MAAKKPVCNIGLFKKFAPKSVRPFTANQLARISQMDPNKKFKLLGVLSQNLDDESSKALKMLAQVGKQRLQSVTRIGVSLEDKEAAAVAEAKRLLSEVGAEDYEAYSRVADDIAKQYRKGDVLTDAERQIVYPIFAKQMQDLPILMQQLDEALLAGDDNMVAFLGSQLTKTMSSAAAIAGDKNAVSVALKSFENLNQMFKNGGKISSFIANGPC
jgi:hypothetical protein